MNIIIALLVLWTIFGFFVLFNLDNPNSIFSNYNLFKAVVAFGPIITVSLLFAFIFFNFIKKVAIWFENK
jgi:hypothetical protein